MAWPKVIFLGFSGVINSIDFFKNKKSNKDERPLPDSLVDQDKILLLNKIVSETKANIVVTSMLRKTKTSEELEDLLRRNGATFRVLDRTPVLTESEESSFLREEEILLWLDNNPFVDYFVVLDSNNKMNKLSKQLVAPNQKNGLQDKQVQDIIARLKS